MMNDKKRRKVFEILMMPIQCTSYSNEKPIIRLVNSVIETTQTYYPYKVWNNKEIYISLDPDMSDFAVGFYEIIYRDVLNAVILDSKDRLSNKEFAGDVMNSYKTVSKRKSNEKSDEYLNKYKKQYHCLANFWMVPMHIGRTSDSTPENFAEWSKMSSKYKIQDYMDRFLNLCQANLEQYKTLYPSYFENIDSFEDFAILNILVRSYVSENMEVYNFSNEDQDRKTIVEKIENNIRLRAEAISESKYAEELWEYFFGNGLLEYKETYYEPNEYPLNKKINPYAYQCPKCNRIIDNDENYSIPPFCDECSKIY